MLGLVQAPGEHDVELVHGDLPVEVRADDSALSVGAHEFLAAEVEQIHEGVVIREVPAGLADLQELVVARLEHVLRVAQFVDRGLDSE